MSKEKEAIKVLVELVTESCNWRVIWFAAQMQTELECQQKGGKCGWEDMSDKQILHRIRQETAELAKATTDKEKIAESIDIANFALFFAMRYKRSK